jgi:hypothetical protein
MNWVHTSLDIATRLPHRPVYVKKFAGRLPRRAYRPPLSLTESMERTTGFEPATLTLAR